MPLLLFAALAATSAQPIVVPLSPLAGRAVAVEATVGGKRGRFLFDTGAGVTTLSPAFAASIGCKPYGETFGYRMTGERIAGQNCGEREVVLGAHKGVADTMVFDFTKIMPADFPAFDGFVGLDALDGEVVTIDLGDRQIIIETPQSLAARTRDMPAGRLRLNREMGGRGLTAFARVPATTGNLWFLVDSGNMANIFASRGALRQWGMDEGAIDAAMKEKTVAVPLKIDGAADAPPRVTAKDIIHDGVINEATIYAFNPTLDLKGGRAWWKIDEKPRR
jgi:hypothetical protein